MRTISPTLHQQATEEVTAYILKISFGSDPVPESAAEHNREKAKQRLQDFLHHCRDAAAKIAREEVAFSTSPKEMEQEVNFWQLYISHTHESLIMLGQAVGLSEDTTKQIITVLFARHAN